MGIDKSKTLEITGLTIGYKVKRKNLVVLEDVDLALNKGELVCFMGKNGIGKSTLLRTISGVQKALSGEVRLAGKLIGAYKPQELATKISLVLTEKPNSGSLSVHELIGMGRYPYLNWTLKMSKVDKQKVDEAIAMTSVEEILQAKLYTLSDGQMQKAMIARALAQDGDTIILDEPTVHLDLNNRLAIMRLLKNMAAEANKAIVMATHELDLALQMADKLWLAHNGNVKEGVPEDLVLNGELDNVFDLKGYDLRTGKIEHDARGTKIKLMGEGHGYLWTKNALERNGYSVCNQDVETIIEISTKNDSFYWTVRQEGRSNVFYSIAELLHFFSS